MHCVRGSWHGASRDMGASWCLCLFTAESVSDLVSNPAKVERVARCQQACAQLIVSLLAPSMQPVRLEDC